MWSDSDFFLWRILKPNSTENSLMRRSICYVLMGICFLQNIKFFVMILLTNEHLLYNSFSLSCYLWCISELHHVAKEYLGIFETVSLLTDNRHAYPVYRVVGLLNIFCIGIVYSQLAAQSDESVLQKILLLLDIITAFEDLCFR